MNEIAKRFYPDGVEIPDQLPPEYQLAGTPGLVMNQRCGNCRYYDNYLGSMCRHWHAPVRVEYWCLKWHPSQFR